jgi:hypothetical protein
MARPDATLTELRDALPTPAGLATIWRALGRLQFTVKGNARRPPERKIDLRPCLCLRSPRIPSQKPNVRFLEAVCARVVAGRLRDAVRTRGSVRIAVGRGPGEKLNKENGKRCKDDWNDCWDAQSWNQAPTDSFRRWRSKIRCTTICVIASTCLAIGGASGSTH